MPGSPNWHHPVNAPTPVNGTIAIVPYDNQWPVLYQRERTRIVEALGDRALSIDHVGSTSVPGLSAKPIIDIMLIVADCADEAVYVLDLLAAGYVLRIREPAKYANGTFDGLGPHRVFKGSGIDLNLHVWSQYSPEIERNLIFRDWLRAHPEDLEIYEQTKLALAKRNWDNVQQYADAKTEVIEQIRNRARAARRNSIG